MNSSPHDGGQVNVRALIASPDGKKFRQSLGARAARKNSRARKKIAARLLDGGGTVSIVGGNVTTTLQLRRQRRHQWGRTRAGKRSRRRVYIENVTIQTSQSGSGGIMTTGGGVMVAKNLTIETQGQSSAPIRTDRGGGSVTVTGGSYTSNGLGSPAIYSTAEVVVNDATLTSNLSEGVCIEGQNSVALKGCTLTANNTQTNGNAQFLDAVILYQSQSGDAADGTSTFSMTGGSLVNKSGHLFHVTNTTAIINLEGVTISSPCATTAGAARPILPHSTQAVRNSRAIF